MHVLGNMRDSATGQKTLRTELIAGLPCHVEKVGAGKSQGVAARGSKCAVGKIMRSLSSMLLEAFAFYPTLIPLEKRLQSCRACAFFAVGASADAMAESPVEDDSTDHLGEDSDKILDLMKLEFKQLRGQLVENVCQELREYLQNAKHSRGSAHLAQPEQRCKVLPLPIDGTRSAESRRTETSGSSSARSQPEAPIEGSGSPGDWLYRPGKAFAPTRMLKKIGEDDMLQKTSSFGGIMTLKRRFSGQAMGQPVWDEGSRRFVKDLSHSPLRSAALPPMPDIPNMPAPALDLEPEAEVDKLKEVATWRHIWHEA